VLPSISVRHASVMDRREPSPDSGKGTLSTTGERLATIRETSKAAALPAPSTHVMAKIQHRI
jgi:hypothetical protein